METYISECGLTVVNALSDYYRMDAFRTEEQTEHILEFSEGILKKDEIKANKKGKHGTIIEFRVSKKYMGTEAKLPIKEVINWIDTLFYLRSEVFAEKKIKAEISIYNGMELDNVIKFKPKPFYQLLGKIIPASIKKKELTDICCISGDSSLIEDTKVLKMDADGTSWVDTEEKEKTIHLDVAFQYVISASYDEPATYDTYCNFTNTVDNGSHLEAFDEAYCRWLQSKVNESMSDSQRNKLKITWDDCRTNLFAVISLSTNAYVGFVGNAKQKIQAPLLVPYLKELITDRLESYFKDNQSQLNDIIKLVKINAKARLEAAKSKTATQVERLNTFKEHKLYTVLYKLS